MRSIIQISKQSFQRALISALLLCPLINISLFSQNLEENNNSLPVNLQPGTREMQSIVRAYPDRINNVTTYKGDLVVEIDNTRYYWAQGRLLTEDKRMKWKDYVEVRFYNYTLGPQKEQKISEYLADRLRERTTARNSDKRIRFNGFLDALYRIHSKEEADRLMVEVSFFDLRTRVHPLLVTSLARIETQITQEAAGDSSVKEFIDSLKQIQGYNWRDIAGTMRRSYHSYGVAVDLIPKRYKHWAYWQWAADSGISDWWNIPITERHQVPQAVIDAFESEGFIWGGKWLFFDNIHFEYRPEVIILSK